MSKRQMLRSLVNERLTAAAEEIFALFERTIAEYEEELCRSKENQGYHHVLQDTALSPRVLLPRADVHTGSSPGPGLNYGGLNQDIAPCQTPLVTEDPNELRVKQEEEHLPVPCSQYTVCVKIEEKHSLQRKTVHREETQGEDTCAQPQSHSEITERHTRYFSSDTDYEEDCGHSCICSTAQLQTEVKKDHYNQVQIRNQRTGAQNSGLSLMDKSALETSAVVNNGDVSRTVKGAEMTKHQCSVCKKSFVSEQKLQQHVNVHTQKRRFSCSVCNSTFVHMSHLRVHMRIHTGERPYSCILCKKTFYQNWNLQAHMRSHTGDKRYSCATCQRAFVHKCALKVHMRIHSGERPYSCSVCEKTFSQNSNLQTHMKSHT